MKLIADCREFSDDMSLMGFSSLLIATLLAIVLSVFIFVTPSLSLLAPIWAAGSVIVVVTLALFLKHRGLIFKVPMKVFEEGLLVQPAMGLKPRVIEFDDVASVELWWGLPYRKTARGCSVLSFRHGTLTTVETFHGKESLKRFAEAIRPALEAHGLRMKPPAEESDSMEFVFQRDVGHHNRPGF
jgi:hypothetical protein